mmetsp:Transcript_2106/g.4771  ORF Transcript_2106/g.4771 Transcript_2106/m.4771 type:complete len:243 (+) Transcript_2106:176-904(+)
MLSLSLCVNVLVAHHIAIRLMLLTCPTALAPTHHHPAPRHVWRPSVNKRALLPAAAAAQKRLTDAIVDISHIDSSSSGRHAPAQRLRPPRAIVVPMLVDVCVGDSMRREGGGKPTRRGRRRGLIVCVSSDGLVPLEVDDGVAELFEEVDHPQQPQQIPHHTQPQHHRLSVTPDSRFGLEGVCDDGDHGDEQHYRVEFVFGRADERPQIVPRHPQAEGELYNQHCEDEDIAEEEDILVLFMPC